jgi:ABC-type dipeptide/oligopeptide/nickel transport system ATPase component
VKRINVIGTTGSGKSTFAKALAKRIGARYFEMDQLYWKPDWQGSTDEELLTNLNQVWCEHSWVLDGNYSRTTELKWGHADTVIWLDYSYIRTLAQLLKRSLTRAILKDEMWPGTGNYESFSRLLFSKESILVWFFRYHSVNKRRYRGMMSNSHYKHITFIRLTSPKLARQFLDQCVNANP